MFDNAVDEQWRADLFALIRATPNLDWLLLTKRIGNAREMLDRAVWLNCRDRTDPTDWDTAWPNVWLGATFVTRDEMLRDAGKLLAVPAHVHFWSVEPMLGNLGEIPADLLPDWVICGGESGHGARPMVLGWAEDIVQQCRAAGVSIFVKQLGARPMTREGKPHAISDSKGAVMEEWPGALRVREVPHAT